MFSCRTLVSIWWIGLGCKDLMFLLLIYLKKKKIFYYHRCSYNTEGSLPRTCCSRLRMTATAWCRMSSLVWGLSLFRCSWHMRPSSLNASLMSLTRKRSRALFANLLSRSLSAFCSGDRSSSSRMLLWTNAHAYQNFAGICSRQDQTICQIILLVCQSVLLQK